MEKLYKTINYVVCGVLVLCAVGVTRMGYEQVRLVRSDRAVDLSTWLPKKQIDRLMRFHGADVLKVTRDAVFIHRDSKWVPVLVREKG